VSSNKQAYSAKTLKTQIIAKHNTNLSWKRFFFF